MIELLIFRVHGEAQTVDYMMACRLHRRSVIRAKYCTIAWPEYYCLRELESL